MIGSRPPLILASNRPPESGADDAEAPRLDFVELTRALCGAPIAYPPASRGIIGRVEEKLSSDIRQAWAAYRQREDFRGFVSLSEKVALPLALLLGKSAPKPHVLVAHNLTSARKRSLQKRTAYLRRFTCIVVLARTQERYLIEEAGVPPEQVRFVSDHVDARFWTPGAARGESADRDVILSVGREQRDYETLAAAARLLPHLRFVVVASSLWSNAGSAAPVEVPTNVEIRRGLSWTALRDLYQDAACVVVPLKAQTAYAAGVNAVLEAMAMRKALIVTRTPGIEDYVEDGATGRYVAPADPAALAAALVALCDDAEGARRMGTTAREHVEKERTLDAYVAVLAQIVREAMPT